MCLECPRCEFRGCDKFAGWSFLWTFPRYQPKFMFACDWHMQQYNDFNNKHIPGLDRPPYADEAWRPSLCEMIRLADIRIKHEDRKAEAPILKERYSPQQNAALQALRRGRAA